MQNPSVLIDAAFREIRHVVGACAGVIRKAARELFMSLAGLVQGCRDNSKNVMLNRGLSVFARFAK